MKWGTALLALGPVLGALSPAAGAKDEVAALLASKRRDLVHSSLHVRARAWRAVASTRDPRALEALVRAYARKGEESHGRALIASTAADSFDTARDAAALAAWRRERDSADDWWLWYRTLRADVGSAGPAESLRVAREGRAAWRRAAALEALAAWAEPEALALVEEIGADLPKEPSERALVLEALAEVYASQAGRRASTEMKRAGHALVGRIEEAESLPRTRLALVRALARVWRPPIPFADAAFWRSVLDAPDGRVDEHGYAAPAAPTFLELAATGDRIVYVIDGSKSMAAALKDDELRGLRQGATADLPWERVRLRIDAAVEFLKLSLHGLRPRHSFCVVLFGTEARTLPSTPGLVPVEAAVMRKVDEEIDRFRVAGSLGETNLHSALRRAFEATDRPSEPGRDAGAPTGPAFLRGPTTVFLLSDGVPSDDAWSATAPTRGDLSKAPWNEGTYADPVQLLDDVERMNLFQRCEIHAVGIAAGGPTSAAGSPAATFLRGLARLGHGRHRMVPSTGPEEAPLPSDPPSPSADEASEGRAALARLREATDALARSSAAAVLGRVRHAEAVPDLIALLEHEDPDLRSAAVDALERITGWRYADGADARRHDRVRARRNWAWWWEANSARFPAVR